MKVLNNIETWIEIADILAGISNGADAKFSQLSGAERAFIEQETNRVLAIIALKVFPKYLQKNAVIPL